MVLSGAIAAITVTGTLYGAGLKIRQDQAKVRFATRHLPPLLLIPDSK